MAPSTTVENTLGAVILGLAGAAVFVGVSTLQAYIYYHKFRLDIPVYKYSVGILWVLDIFHLMLVVHSVYFYAVTNFGHPQTQIVWSMKLQVPVNVMIVGIVQSLYVFRVWLLGALYHNRFLRFICVAIVVAGFAISFVLVHEVYTVDDYRDIGQISWAMTTGYVAATVTDFMIAGVMCYYLAKSKTRSMRLDSALSKLTAYTLNSGALTSACSLTALFTWILLPHTFQSEAISFFLTKLYIGSYFAMLNARSPHEKKDFRDTSRDRSRLAVDIPVFSNSRNTRSPVIGSPLASKEQPDHQW